MDREVLDWLVQRAVDLACHHLGFPTGPLEAFPPHQLDEDRELKLPAPLGPRSVGAHSRKHTQRHIPDQFLCEARLDHARCQAFAVRPASGEVLIPIVIARLGSSTPMTGSGWGSSRSARVSPIVTSGMPATATSSPGPASAVSTRSSASVT